jgi:hypothetical protein
MQSIPARPASRLKIAPFRCTLSVPGLASMALTYVCLHGVGNARLVQSTCHLLWCASHSVTHVEVAAGLNSGCVDWPGVQRR